MRLEERGKNSSQAPKRVHCSGNMWRLCFDTANLNVVVHTNLRLRIYTPKCLLTRRILVPLERRHVYWRSCPVLSGYTRRVDCPPFLLAICMLKNPPYHIGTTQVHWVVAGGRLPFLFGYWGRITTTPAAVDSMYELSVIEHARRCPKHPTGTVCSCMAFTLIVSLSPYLWISSLSPSLASGGDASISLFRFCLEPRSD